MDKFDELVEQAKQASKENDYLKSNDFYNQALDCKKEDYLFFEIGKNYLNMNKYSEAERYFNLYLNGADQSADFSYYSLLFLAKIYKLTGFFRKAAAACEKARKYAADDLKNYEISRELKDINFLFYERIPKNLKKDEYKDLEKKYIDRIKSNPANINAVVNLAEIYLIKREYKKLVEFIKEHISLIPENEIFFINKLLNFLEISQGKTILKSNPVRLGVNLSNKCNLQCIMCYVKDFDWNFPVERLGEIKQYFPYLEKIMWQGGEVFCLSYFTDLIKEAAKYPNLQQGIITNGQLLNKEITDLLVNMNLELTVSVDGACKKTYEAIRKNSDFEKLVKNIQYLSCARDKENKNFILGMNVVVSKHNDGELLSLFEIAHRYNFDFFCIMPLKQGDIFEIYNNDLVTKQIREIQKRNKQYNMAIENRITLLAEHLADNDIEVKEDINGWIRYENHTGAHTSVKQNLCKDYINVNNENKMTVDIGEIDVNLYNKNPLVCHIPWIQMILDFDATIWPDCQCRAEKNKNALAFSN
ncbi:MAG: radical SAM protein, partial [Endomicrobiaceae bacterium]